MSASFINMNEYTQCCVERISTVGAVQSKGKDKLTINHLGDSGSQGTVANKIMINRNWKARGMRHAALPPT
jgi:hypothetical protein